MTLEEKIRKIEEKIANLPQEFGVEERHIINNNRHLIELIHQTLLKNPQLISEEVFACLTDEVLVSLEKEHNQEVYYHYLNNKLKESIPATTYLEDYLERANLPEEQKKYFREIVSNAFKNKEITLDKFEISDEIIIEMRNYGRFDLISQIKEVYLDDSTLQEIWNSYPFNEYPFPSFFAKNDYIARKYIDKFPLKEAIIAYVIFTSYINDSSDYEREAACNLLPTFIKVIKEKLNNVETLDLSFLYEDNYNFRTLVPNDYNIEKINEENKKGMIEIAIKLFNFGLYDIANELVILKLLTKKEIRKILVELLTNKNYELLKKLRFVNFSSYFRDDLELANMFLKNGFIEDAELISYEFVEQEKNYIIEQLNNKNELFKDYSKKIFYSGVSHTTEESKIFLAKLNSGFVEEIYAGRLIEDTDENINEMISVLTNYPYTKLNCNNLSITCFLKILDTIIETKRTETIIDFIVGSSYPENVELFKDQRIHKFLKDIITKDFDLGLKIAHLKLKTIIEVPDLLGEYFKNNKYIERILDFVNHNETLESFYTLETYNKIKFYLSNLYQIPVENLDRIQQIAGPLIIRYIDNENIQSITKLSIEEQEKIFALFPEDEFTLQDLTSAYDSLKQYEFSNKYDNQVQIFTILLHAIDNEDEELIDSLIIEISKELDEIFLKRFIKKYDLPSEYNQDNIKELVQLVVNKLRISKGEKLEKYQTILHEMTDYYISKKREEYRNTYNMEEELQLFYDFDEKSAERALIKYIIMDSQTIQTSFAKPIENQEVQLTEDFFSEWDTWDFTPIEYYSLYEKLILKLEEKGIEKELAKETIDYYIDKEKNMCRDFALVQKTIPELIKITKEIIESVKGFQYVNQYGIYLQLVNDYRNEADSRNEIKRIYKINSENNILEILTRLNIPTLQKGVLSNPEAYDSLLKTMEKRKLHLLPSNLSHILGSEYINISTDLTNVAGFISFYGKIFNDTKSSLEANGKSSDNIILNLTTILIYAKVYSGISSVYSQILGNEDAKIIKANPGPNSATRKIANEGRLKEAIELTKKLFERKEITIPPFEQDASIGDNKKLHVIVGNFTHPSNLTHGERTGSCMRIGGVGESLFSFAIDNPNGFHIRFEDPITREYISRVTGFRNGNTVFLNELRESRNQDKYSNEDVIEACKVAAQKLIELSKNSPCPIENVVVHRAYATQNMPSKMEYLGVTYIKQGLPQFYTDVSSSAIILATSSKEAKFVPLNFDKSHVPTYQPLRETPKVPKDFQEASDRINRVHSVKKLIAGEYYEYIEPLQFPNGLIYAIVSEDWYIYVNKNGEIIKEIIDIDPRAKDELAENLIEIEKNISQIKSGNQEAKYGL